MATKSLWKPTADAKTGHYGSVFISDSQLGPVVKIYDADTHQVIATGRYDKVYANEGKWKGGYIYRFDLTGNNISKVTKSAVIVGDNGQYYWIGDALRRGEDVTSGGTLPQNQTGDKANSLFNFDAVNRTETGTWSIPDDSESSVSGIKGIGHVAKPELLDPNLNQLTQISDTQIEFTDPISVLRDIAKENKGQVDENLIKSLEYAGKLSEANTQQLIDYLDTMTPYQRQLIGIENAFNQQEKLKAAETAIPGVTDMLRGELKNAQTLASGRLLTDSEDRALEQVSRSAGADAAWTRGLGDDSLVGQTLSDQLSVNQRQQVMAQGQNYLSQALQNATSVLMDTPQKATMGSQIPAQPRQSIGELALQEQQILNQYTTMSPESALNAYINQRQAQAQLDYNTKATNANLQEAYTQRGIDIAASNIQAMNNFNQNVINDQSNTSYASSTNEAMNMLNFAEKELDLSPEEYNKYREQIEAGNPPDFAMIGRQKNGSKYNFYERYRTKSQNLGKFTNPNDNDNNISNEENTPQTSRSTYLEEDDTSINIPRTAVFHSKDTYTEGYDKNKLIQSDGTITIPTANANFMNSGYFSTLEYIANITKSDLGGLV